MTDSVNTSSTLSLSPDLFHLKLSRLCWCNPLLGTIQPQAACISSVCCSFPIPCSQAAVLTFYAACFAVESCWDTDGCEDNPCFRGVNCTDAIAPNEDYICDACPSGYTGDGESCTDVDDCQHHPCGHNGNCTDTGTHSYDCSCGAGFDFVAGSPGVDCQEIRLCDLREDDCHVNATCTHTGPGQHSCACTHGYSGDGRSCIDTDGCMPDPCFVDVNCTDIPAPNLGSFCDACPEGYNGTGLAGDCYDIDDCVGSPCGDDINNCTDAGAVSYVCDCGVGYGYDENAGTCVELLTMTVAANLDEITASPAALNAFKIEFSGGLASMLGVDALRVKVMGMSAGSVVVNFIIMSPPPVVSSADATQTGITFLRCLQNAGMIETEAECQAAAQQLSIPWDGAAGTEWASGCIFHGGSVYYSPHADGTTQDPTDAYIW